MPMGIAPGQPSPASCRSRLWTYTSSIRGPPFSCHFNAATQGGTICWCASAGTPRQPAVILKRALLARILSGLRFPHPGELGGVARDFRGAVDRGFAGVGAGTHRHHGLSDPNVCRKATRDGAALCVRGLDAGYLGAHHPPRGSVIGYRDHLGRTAGHGGDVAPRRDGSGVWPGIVGGGGGFHCRIVGQLGRGFLVGQPARGDEIGDGATAPSVKGQGKGRSRRSQKSRGSESPRVGCFDTRSYVPVALGQNLI
ncbi:hypothetical protein SBA3_2270001 [Candidatus Sulfopaludibacter sp. SbA3]|nr:hypothetical protein SBA3_2270001 [Candidatus Sulfopaludibacter sp. SbA3]